MGDEIVVESIDEIVVESISRFARNTKDLLLLVEKLTAKDSERESVLNKRFSGTYERRAAEGATDTDTRHAMFGSTIILRVALACGDWRNDL